MGDRVAYILAEAWRNLRATPMITLTSIGIIALAFLVFATFLLVVLNVSAFLDRWGADIRIDVYVADGTSSADFAALAEQVETRDGVERVEAITKDAALTEFRTILGDDSILLDSLPRNPLPASLKVYPTAEARLDIEPLTAALRDFPHVTDVRASTEWLNQLSGVMTLLRLTGFGVGGILFLASALIISNAIRLSLYARRDEIEIMQLVGATNRFIVTPFYLEGAATGGGAAILALLLLRGLFALFLGSVTIPLGTLGSVGLVFLPPILAGMFIAGGVVLGLGGSAVALSRLMN